MLITQIQLAAISDLRRVPKAKRRDFFLYVDEAFQIFAAQFSFVRILLETRNTG